MYKEKVLDLRVLLMKNWGKKKIYKKKTFIILFSINAMLFSLGSERFFKSV